MFSIEEFNKLPATCRATITENTINQENNKTRQHHSIPSIVEDNRHLAIASRMIRKPVEFTTYKLNSKDELEALGTIAYLGSQIADIFIESVHKNSFCYYPLTGNWEDTGVKQLVLFVKTDGIYKPYARFSVDKVIKRDNMTIEELKTLTDITPVCNSNYKSILKISNVETTNLPTNYIGIRSGVDLYESAFKGSAPNLLMI